MNVSKRIAVAAGGLAVMFATTAVQAVDYVAPFFTGPQTTASVYTDGNGGQWIAMSEEPFGQPFSAVRPMGWNAANNRWERTNVSGDTFFPDNGTYEAGPQMTVVGGGSFPSLAFRAPVTGSYSIDGTLLITGPTPRAYVQVASPPSANGNLLTGALVAAAGNYTDLAYDYGAVAEYQNIALNAGDYLQLIFYAGGTQTEATVFNLGGPDPVKIVGPAIPEPATLGLLGAGALVLVSRKRTRD